MASLSDSQFVEFAGVPAHFHRDAAPGPHQLRRRVAVLRMLEGLGGSLLDVGCGYGDLAYAMSKRFAPLAGVDVKPGQIAFANRQYEPIRFSVCADQGLEFGDASFDNVTSIVVLPFVPDVDRHMEELRRILKPGGHLLVAAKALSLPRRLRRRIFGHGRLPDSGLHLHSASELAELMRRHGFAVVRHDAFYDPPFANHRNAADLLCSAVEWVGEQLGIDRLAPYPMVLGRLEQTNPKS